MQENKKVNQRIAATKRALQDALIEMLKTQNNQEPQGICTAACLRCQQNGDSYIVSLAFSNSK